MAKSTDNSAVTSMVELMVTCLASSDALIKLLIEKQLITRDEFFKKLAIERVAYQKLFNPIPQ